MEWTIESAQHDFATLIDRALTEGPQHLRAAEATVVIISEREYKLLQGRKPSLIELILNGPDLSGVDLERDRSPMREFDWD